jgi:hypothetical protein
VAEGYDRVVASWRAQRTTAVSIPTNIDRTIRENDDLVEDMSND